MRKKKKKVDKIFAGGSGESMKRKRLNDTVKDFKNCGEH